MQGISFPMAVEQHRRLSIVWPITLISFSVLITFHIWYLLSSNMIFFLCDRSNRQLLLAVRRSESHNISYLNNALFCFLVLVDAMFSDLHAAKIFFLICDLGHFASSQLMFLVALPSLLRQVKIPIFYVNDTEGYSKPMHCSSDVKLLHPVLVSLWCKDFTAHVLAESYFLLPRLESTCISTWEHPPLCFFMSCLNTPFVSEKGWASQVTEVSTLVLHNNISFPSSHWLLSTVFSHLVLLLSGLWACSLDMDLGKAHS